VTPTVAEALAAVHYDSQGTAVFDKAEDAKAFFDGVYEKFDPIGYGTSCHGHEADGKFIVQWRVFCAD